MKKNIRTVGGRVFVAVSVAVNLAALSGCDPECSRKESPRVEALDASAWKGSQWLSAKDAPVYDGAVSDGMKAAPGTSWFVSEIANAGEVASVRWMTAGLGVYEVYVNGRPVGHDFLKPGFTHREKTKYAFTYDVTKLLKSGAGEANVFAAEVSAGWWRDKIVSFIGKKSAFRGMLEIVYADGTKQFLGTNRSDWKCGVAGPVTHAAIFDGEEYDARLAAPYFGEGLKALLRPTKPLLLPGVTILSRHQPALTSAARAFSSPLPVFMSFVTS